MFGSASTDTETNTLLLLLSRVSFFYQNFLIFIFIWGFLYLVGLSHIYMKVCYEFHFQKYYWQSWISDLINNVLERIASKITVDFNTFNTTKKLLKSYFHIFQLELIIKLYIVIRIHLIFLALIFFLQIVLIALKRRQL